MNDISLNITNISQINDFMEKMLFELLHLMYINQCNTLIKRREDVTYAYLIKRKLV